MQGGMGNSMGDPSGQYGFGRNGMPPPSGGGFGMSQPNQPRQGGPSPFILEGPGRGPGDSSLVGQQAPEGTGGYTPFQRPTYQNMSPAAAVGGTPFPQRPTYQNMGPTNGMPNLTGGLTPRDQFSGLPTNGMPNQTGGLTPANQFAGGLPQGYGAMDANMQQLGRSMPQTPQAPGGITLPPNFGSPNGGGVMGADGQRYADRNSSPRAYTGGAFNPAANQWGDYSQRQGDGLFGTDAQGINRFNGNVFAPSGLNSGNNDFANFLGRFAPQFQRQNGPINMGRAQTWGAPQGVLQGSGLNRGNGEPPRHGLPGDVSIPNTRPSWQVGDASNSPWHNPYRGSGLSRGNGPQFDPRRTGAKPPPPTFAPWNIRNPFLK